MSLLDEIVAGNAILSAYTSYASGKPVLVAVVQIGGRSRFIYAAAAEALCRGARRRVHVKEVVR